MTKDVLIVDDDRQMVRTLSDIVRLHGWEAHGAYSGEEAIAAVEARSFAMVLMDVRMGGVNGVDAFRAMKAIRPAIRVALMTAYTASDLIAEAEREGALRVLPKPVALPVLIEMLDTAAAADRRVLVIDEDACYLRTLGDALRHRGYRVLEANTLAAAIARLEEHAPGAVILDLGLDSIAPDESVLAIRRVSPAVALILYSGHGPPALDALNTALSVPQIYATLRKPFPPDHLLKLLDAIFA